MIPLEIFDYNEIKIITSETERNISQNEQPPIPDCYSIDSVSNAEDSNKITMKLLQKQGSPKNIQVPANALRRKSEVSQKYSSSQHNKSSEKTE